MRAHFFVVGLTIGLILFSALTAAAWTGPSSSPPNNNVSAPLNVGTLSQVKNGNIGVNGLAVYGNSLLDWNVNGGGTLTYLNFSDLTSNPLTQSSGYGIRDNAGTLEFKNSGGSWQSLQAIVAGLGAGLWTQSGSSIYYTSGYVGIDTPSPSSALTVNGTITNSSSANNYWNSNALNINGGNGTLYVQNIDDNGANTDITLGGGVATFPRGPYTNDWFRVNTTGGIYWQAYGGGWYMQDSTWLRSYNGKPVYMGGGFDTGNPAGIGCGGGLGAGYTLRVCGSEDVSSSVTAAAFYYNSDERLKRNIASIATSTALSDVLALRPVTFNWNNVSLGTTTQIGFIAQEVQQVVPQIVETNASTTMEAVDYARVTPLLVGSVQALDQTIQDQQQEIDLQQGQITAQQNAIASQQKEIDNLIVELQPLQHK